MRHTRNLILWTAGGLLGLALMVWAYPRLYPLLPARWEISRAEAEAIALERLRALGEPVADPYVVVRLRSDVQLERRLQFLSEEIAGLREHRLADSLLMWDVLVYSPGATPDRWTYRAMVTLDGRVLALRRYVDDAREETRPNLPPEELHRRAVASLVEEGVDVSGLAPGGDLTGEGRLFQMRWHDDVLGDRLPWGLEVAFDGDEPAGYSLWYRDPARDELQSVLRQAQILGIGRAVLLYVLLPLVAVPFLRRYHDGQLGVRRGVQLFLVVLGAGLVSLLLNAPTISQSWSLGVVTRHQVTWMVVVFGLVFQVLGIAALGLMTWSVGEYFCRQQWPEKLASIDALFRFKVANATVARAALRGVAGGLLMTGVLLALTLSLPTHDAWPTAGIFVDGVLSAPAPWLANLAEGGVELPMWLLGCLLAPCWGVRKLGPKLGLVLGVVTVAAVTPRFLVLPMQWSWAVWALVAVVPIALVKTSDLLSALWAGLSVQWWLAALPALHADDRGIQLAGWTLVVLILLPLLLSLKNLDSDHEFVYTYDDVPPHVRRIQERERQRVELETAARIQSSILPELPDQLNGVEIAHAYLPASEVGGDFYDVLALDDGRLAVAVGDVAGHGVSSGLVMSMAKSALAVQVTFDPEVEPVFRTLNRMVYQSARQRLLATLCYALVDPQKRELHYASAGHLFPYRISTAGKVDAYEASAYPLGVRDQIDVRVHAARLEAGDTLFLYSDGLIESCADGSDEQFGFERLEQSLSRHAGMSPGIFRDAVLMDVEAFTGPRPREDDITVLVLRLPRA